MAHNRDEPEPLAICGNCGTIFRTRGVASGPGDPQKCPVCGNQTRIFDAETFIAPHIREVLLGSGRTVDDLRTYAEVVDNLRRDLSNDELNAKEVPERLRREAPELAKLADVLPKTRSDLYEVLHLVLTAIALCLSYLTYRTIRGDGPQEVHIQVDEITIDQQIKHLPQLFASLEKQPSPSVFDPAPKTLSKRNMCRRIDQANAVRKWGGGQRVFLRFKRSDLIKTEEWVALHSHYVRPDGGYTLVQEKFRRIKRRGG